MNFITYLKNYIRSILYPILVFIGLEAYAKEEYPSYRDPDETSIVTEFLEASTPKITIPNVATIELPLGYLVTSRKDALKFMKMFNYYQDEEVVAVASKLGPEILEAIIYIEYRQGACIDNKDAKSWDTDQLLRILKFNYLESVAAQPGNEARIYKWLLAPKYDFDKHQLLLGTSRKAMTSNGYKTVPRYQGFVFGCDGHFTLYFYQPINAPVLSE